MARHPRQAATDEEAEMYRRRWREASDAGMTTLEARLYAEADDIDSGALRRLVKKKCPRELVARILL